MNKQEVMDWLQITELPTKAKLSNEKCAVLVERQNHKQDYAIAQGGGVVIDKRPQAAIVRIIEYYPVEKVAAADVVLDVNVIPETEWRKKTIDFLVKNKMNRKVMESNTDEELEKIMKIYKK